MIFLITNAKDVIVQDQTISSLSNPDFRIAVNSNVLDVTSDGTIFVESDGAPIFIEDGNAVPVTTLFQFTALAAGEAGALIGSQIDVESFISFQAEDVRNFPGWSVFELSQSGLVEYEGGDQLDVSGYWSGELPVSDDFVGAKIAVYGDNRLNQFVEDAGGIPVPIAFGELFSALSAGVIDGAISTDAGFFEDLEVPGFSIFSADLGSDGFMNITNSATVLPPQPVNGDDGGAVQDGAEPAIVFDLGGIFDLSFNQSAFEGAERWAAETGETYGSLELQNDAQREPALRRFAEQDSSPIVAVGLSQNAAVAQLASEFPNIEFAIIDSVVDQPNVGSYTFDVSEGAYVMGVIAATASTTGTVGFIGGMDADLSRNYVEAFEQGARETRADIEVLVNMTGTTTAAWNDPVRGAELAEAQMSQGADVIFTPAGGTSFGVLQAIADFTGNADFERAYAIANESNLNFLHPGSVLTSLVKDFGFVVEDVFTNGVTVGTNELGFAEGGLSYAIDENNADILTPEMRAAADDAIAGFASDQEGGTDTGPATEGPDFLDGTAEDEVLSGLDGNDTITGGAGDDQIEGGNGDDTAVYSGDRAAYTVTLSPDGAQVIDRRTDGDGTDQLTGIETLAFADGDWRFDIFDDVAQLSEEALRSFVEVYIAYFNRAPDAEGLFFYGTAFANGTSLEASAATFLNSTEYAAAYPPGQSNQVFAEAVYNNVLGRQPDPLGIEFWVNQLDSGNVPRDVFIVAVLEGAKAPPSEDATPEFVAQQNADQDYLSSKTDVGMYFATTNGLSNVANATTAMQLFDKGEPDDIVAAVAAIDGFYSDALGANTGEFLIQLVGVVEDPFGV